ncbi:MAG TPA: carboxypeptidase regulatory-like domain-containing protein [Ilumatobacteraceae bacterium]|nr:carboxypeptidase regulatory-like domain-containing protein [Ilumatobacteraceae bacterium]
MTSRIPLACLVMRIAATCVVLLGLAVPASALASDEIHVEKSGPQYAHEGESLHYTMHVTNPGTGALSDIVVADTLCDAADNSVSGPFEALDDNGDDSLDPGEDWTYSCNVTVPSDRESDTVTNTATATGTPAEGDDVNDSDSVDTEIVHPGFTFDKSGPDEVIAGKTFNWYMILHNTGDVALTVDVSDSACDPEDELTDINLPVSPYATYVYCYATAPDDGSTELSNTACAVGSDPTVGREGPFSCAVEDGCTEEVVLLSNPDNIGQSQHCDTATTTVVHPNMTLTKNVDLSTADPFDTLNYTIKVANTGDIGLTVFPEDVGCDGFGPQADSFSQISYLDPGETLTLTCNHVFDPEQDGGSYTNTACAIGFPYNYFEDSVHSDGKFPRCNPSSDCEEFTNTNELGRCASATTTLATHQVSGRVFEDMNADGAKQDGEPAFPGVVVYADLNNNGTRDPGEPSTTSGADGGWVLSIALGQTTIREEVPGGATCSFPAGCAYTVDLPKNNPPAPPDVPSRRIANKASDPAGKDFGDWRPASVTGTVSNTKGAALPGIQVYADLNGNGTADAGEPSTQTDANGAYALAGLKPGGYVIRHVVPADGSSCVSPTGCNYNLTLVSHAAESHKDFVEDKPAQLVLPARIIPGVARLSAKTGCIASKGFDARIRGRKMLRITFFIDGHAMKSVVRPKDNATYRYRVNVAKLKVGRHHLAVKVTFRSQSHTKSKTLRSTFQRCAAQRRAPAFTG